MLVFIDTNSTQSLCSSNDFSKAPVEIFHFFAASSSLPVNNYLPSLLTQTDVTQSLCSSNDFSKDPVEIFHFFALLSELPVNNYLPSLLT